MEPKPEGNAEEPKGYEIPVPKRKDLMDAFRKIIGPREAEALALSRAAASRSRNIS